MLFCQFRQSLVSVQGLLELNEGKEEKPLVSIFSELFTLAHCGS